MPIRDWIYIAVMRYETPGLKEYLHEHGTPPFPILNEEEDDSQVTEEYEDKNTDEQHSTFRQ